MPYTAHYRVGLEQELAMMRTSVLTSVLLALVATAAAQSERYINCGGPSLQEATNDWDADKMADGSLPYVTSTSPTIEHFTPATIQSTMWGPIYKTHRYTNTGDLKYSIPVRGSMHTVKLLFAETYFNAAGQRSFTVMVNGQNWLDTLTGASDLDVFAKAGGKNKALMVDFKMVDTSATGAIEITLGRVTGKNNPFISAIVVDYQTMSKAQIGNAAPVAMQM